MTTWVVTNGKCHAYVVDSSALCGPVYAARVLYMSCEDNHDWTRVRKKNTRGQRTAVVRRCRYTHTLPKPAPLSLPLPTNCLGGPYQGPLAVGQPLS